MSAIKVSRNGESREFSKEVWDKMPEGKYGWAPAPEVPDAVKKIIDAQPNGDAGNGENTPTDADLQTGKPKDELLNNEPTHKAPDAVKEKDITAGTKPKAKQNADTKK